METNNDYSFQKGLDKVPSGKLQEVKSEIMKALKIKSHPQWLKRLRGEIDPKTKEVTAIEDVFKKHGIKDIWGN